MRHSSTVMLIMALIFVLPLVGGAVASYAAVYANSGLAKAAEAVSAFIMFVTSLKYYAFMKIANKGERL